jgi:hypothetical protein
VLEVSASWQMTRMIEIALDEIIKLNPSADEWKTILGVSENHKSILQKSRALAIQQISLTISRSGMNKIRLARQYKVNEWLRLGLQDLVESHTHFRGGATRVGLRDDMQIVSYPGKVPKSRIPELQMQKREHCCQGYLLDTRGYRDVLQGGVGGSSREYRLPCLRLSRGMFTA